jgi:hypothetical protein
MTLSESGEWARLQELKLGPPDTYASAYAYRDDIFVTDLLRKLAIPGNAKGRLAAAKQTFYQAEAQCLRTNGYLRHLEKGHLDTNDSKVMDFITSWRAIVKDVLGALPKRLYPRYSPGSTLSDVGSLITIPDKMSSLASCYPHSRSVADHSVLGTELETQWAPVERRANRFFTVPKDASKDRGCCVEASLNVMLQLDVGALMKRRYNGYYKVRLEHAKPLHMLAARLASMGAPYATIDLSNASDTVAKDLVRMLLPWEWYELLESLRARATYVDGKTVYLEKFSSMGNGFTFELETLLFRTLAQALGAGSDDCLVFGDDIVVHSSIAPSMLSALRRFGFTPNERKTFCEGPFRESCGGDYWRGLDVRPIYLKEIPDEPQKWIALHNQLYRWDHDKRLNAARRYCMDQVPLNWRYEGPNDGNDHWFYTDDPKPHIAGKSKRLTKVGIAPGTPGFYGRVPIPRRIVLSARWFRPRVVIASALLGVGEMVSLRGKIEGFKRTFIPAWGLSDSKTRELFPSLIS